MQKILYVSTERNKRLEQAFKIVYNPIMKISISEEVEKIAKYTQFKWKSDGERELVKAYISETEEEYHLKRSLHSFYMYKLFHMKCSFDIYLFIFQT